MSSIDRERPLVAVRGFLSIIIPDFAFVDPDNVEPWGVYEYVSQRSWRELSVTEKVERLIVDDSILRID